MNILKTSLRLACCLAILGSSRLAFSADPPVTDNHYRQEVRDRLTQLQTNIDQLFANHLLTTDQYHTESERVRQLQLQMHVDSQAEGKMSEDDRNNQFNLIDQIKMESSRMADANRASAAAAAASNPSASATGSNTAASNTSVAPSSASVAVNTSSAAVTNSSSTAK